MSRRAGLLRKVAAVTESGSVRLLQQELPSVEPGMVLVDVRASLVSPGTELGGWRGLSERRRQGGDPDKAKPFGYSNAGVVRETGAEVERFREGDRVACIGYGYALHTDLAVVPQNLCVPLPPSVDYARGSYGMLMATALHSLRRCEPVLGENVAIVGLGLVGQLTAQFHRLAGNFVIGWGRHDMRVDIAKRWGIDQAINVKQDDAVRRTLSFTREQGLDAAVLAFGGPAGQSYEDLCRCMKKTPDGHLMGRIVIVGGARMEMAWIPANFDVRIAARTGPGYHDDQWERGADYPPVVVPWTTNSNLGLCMRLLEERRVDVDCLTTHRIPLESVEEEVDGLLDNPEEVLGVVFTNGGRDEAS